MGFRSYMGVWPWPTQWTPFSASPALPSGQSYCLCPCLPFEIVDVVVPFCFHTSRIGIPARVGRVIGNFERLHPRGIIDPAPRNFAVSRCLASVASITAWSRFPFAVMLKNASRSCVTRSKRILFCKISVAKASTSTLPGFSVYFRPYGVTTSMRPLSARYLRTASFFINTLLVTGTLLPIITTPSFWRT